MPEPTGQKSGITLRLSSQDRQAVHAVMALTERATQAGAILQVVREYPALLKRVEEIETQAGLAELQRKVHAMLYKMDGLNVAQAALDDARLDVEALLFPTKATDEARVEPE